MKISLNRNKILLIAIAIVFIFLIINRLNKIQKSSFTTGKVKGTEIIKSRRYNSEISRYAVIEFGFNGDTIQFGGEQNVDYELGEEVKVIYSNDNPEKAKVYSFAGFWLAPLLYCIIPIWLLAALVLSLLSKDDKVIIKIGKNISVTKEKPDNFNRIIKLSDNRELPTCPN